MYFNTEYRTFREDLLKYRIQDLEGVFTLIQNTGHRGSIYSNTEYRLSVWEVQRIRQFKFKKNNIEQAYCEIV